MVIFSNFLLLIHGNNDSLSIALSITVEPYILLFKDTYYRTMENCCGIVDVLPGDCCGKYGLIIHWLGIEELAVAQTDTIAVRRGGPFWLPGPQPYRDKKVNMNHYCAELRL